MLEKALLLGVEVDVLAEERVELFPAVVLAECIHASHLSALGDHTG